MKKRVRPRVPEIINANIITYKMYVILCIFHMFVMLKNVKRFVKIIIFCLINAGHVWNIFNPKNIGVAILVFKLYASETWLVCFIHDKHFKNKITFPLT